MIVMATAPLADDRKKQIDSNSPLSNEVDPASMMSLFNVASANNVSVEQLAMALRNRQQQTFYPTTTEDVTTSTTTTTVTALPTTTTTPPPPPPLPATMEYIPDEQPTVAKKIAIKPYKAKYASSHNKVMNAPKEYYPVGYDKNFDDNFVSKVDLPDTTFSCGDQKHFPGLYGDEDLGCMVSASLFFFSLDIIILNKVYCGCVSQRSIRTVGFKQNTLPLLSKFTSYINLIL